MQRLKPILHPPDLLRVRRGGSERLGELFEARSHSQEVVELASETIPTWLPRLGRKRLWPLRAECIYHPCRQNKNTVPGTQQVLN